jgi:hypothetical protein
MNAFSDMPGVDRAPNYLDSEANITGVGVGTPCVFTLNRGVSKAALVVGYDRHCEGAMPRITAIVFGSDGTSGVIGPLPWSSTPRDGFLSPAPVPK